MGLGLAAREVCARHEAWPMKPWRPIGGAGHGVGAASADRGLGRVVGGFIPVACAFRWGVLCRGSARSAAQPMAAVHRDSATSSAGMQAPAGEGGRADASTLRPPRHRVRERERELNMHVMRVARPMASGQPRRSGRAMESGQSVALQQPMESGSPSGFWRLRHAGSWGSPGGLWSRGTPQGRRSPCE